MTIARTSEDRLQHIVFKYKAALGLQEQQDLDNYLEKIKADLIVLLDGNEHQAEVLVEDKIKLFVEKRQGVSETLQAEYVSSGADELNPIIESIHKIDIKACNMLENLKKNQYQDEDNEEIFAPIEKLCGIAFKKLNMLLLVPINAGFEHLNYIEELSNVCAGIISISKAIVDSSKSCFNANRLLDFQYWLKRQIILRDILLNDIDKLESLKPNFATTEALSNEIISKFYKKVFPNNEIHVKKHKVEVSSLPIDKFRLRFERTLPYDHEFRKLSLEDQENIIYELEKMHLKNQLNVCENDINARLSAEAIDEKINKKEIIKIVSDDQRIKVKDIFKKSACAIEDFLRNEKIKAELQYYAKAKTKKLVGRIFTLIGLGLGLGLIIAAIASAPAVVLIGLAAGVVCGLLIAKCIHPDDSLTKITQKGFRYFSTKIHSLFRPDTKLQQMHQANQLADKETRHVRFAKNVSKLAFNNYLKKVEKNEMDKIAEAEAKELVGQEGVLNSEAAVKEKLQALSENAPITQHPEIRAAKKYKGMQRFVSGLQQLEKQASELYETMGLNEINQTVNDIGYCVRELEGNSQIIFGANVASRINLAKLKKATVRVIAMAAYVISTSYKCARAHSILNFNVWLKRQLIDRFKWQEESQKINRFLSSHQSSLSELMAKDDVYYKGYYDKLFSTSKPRDSEVTVHILDLTLSKFREKLKEKLAVDADFFKMPDEDQIHLIAKLENEFLNEKITKCEKDMLLRANVEMVSKTDEKREALASDVRSNYLAYEVYSKNEFISKLNTAIIKPNPSKKSTTNSDSKDDFDCNKEMVEHLKENLNNKRKKMVARCFLLLFAGLSCAAIVAGIAFAPVPIIIALTVGALACLLVAKLVKKDENVTETLKKSFTHLSQKVRKQFSLWDVKPAMSKTPEIGNDLTPKPSNQ